MRRIGTILVLLLFIAGMVRGESFDKKVSLIPYPTKISLSQGSYKFTDKSVIIVQDDSQKAEAEKFVKLFAEAASFAPSIKKAPAKGDILLTEDKSLKDESYKINVTASRITISASSSKGFYYAFQSLQQMLPYKNMPKGAVKSDWKLNAMDIEDSPRFEYRGVMLDVARFFIPKEDVLSVIDCMGMLKLNKLHLHLVDDNGWRIEIKKYPLLTEVGANRVFRSDVEFPSRKNPRQGEQTFPNGYYTQDDIREIVKYAAEHHIEVIPEIEMPAHSNAALAAYPLLACPVVDKYIGVLPGLGGQNADVIFCAGNDSVFTFLENILDEVMELFPSRYIHIGGDEAKKTHWNRCPLCRKRIADEHLNNSEELQGYFMKRISAYLNKKGREVMGWDELTNSSIPEGAVIMGWQGMGTAALKAAKLGHKFIMTPARVLYLIRYQGPQWFEPLTYFGNNTLKDVYDYEPIEEGWSKEEASLLIGVQASLWTEFCNTPKDVEYLIYPRLMAFAEVGWMGKENKDWKRFLKNLDVFNNRLDAKGITYAKSMFNIQHIASVNNGKIEINLDCIRPDVEIRYTLDGKTPTKKSKLYNGNVVITKSCTLKANTFQDGKQMGQLLEIPVIWNKACGKPIYTSNSGSIDLLVNGVEGSKKYTDGEWCNWYKCDSASFVIDLLSEQKLEKITLGVINNFGMGIHKPKSIELSTSSDNKSWKQYDKFVFGDTDIFKEGIFIERLNLKVSGNARYIKVDIKGAGKLPPAHVRATQDSRFMFDEIVVE